MCAVSRSEADQAKQALSRARGRILMLAVALSVACTTVFGQDEAEIPAGFQHRIRASVACMWGDTGFEESGDSWRSKLVWPADAWMGGIEACGAYGFIFRERECAVGFRARFARDLTMEGTSTDRDWDGYGNPVASSWSDSEGELTMWSIRGELVTGFPEAAFPVPDRLGVFMGYGEERFSYEDSNLRADYDVPVSPSQVNATYELDFSGARLGLFGSSEITETLSCSAELEWIPFLSAESDALWVLRNYPFQQSANGSGIVVGAELAYRLTSLISAHLGIKWTSLIADENGEENGVLDGAAYEGAEIVDELTSEFASVELALSASF